MKHKLLLMNTATWMTDLIAKADTTENSNENSHMRQALLYKDANKWSLKQNCDIWPLVHFYSKISKKRPLQLMTIVIGPC